MSCEIIYIYTVDSMYTMHTVARFLINKDAHTRIFTSNQHRWTVHHLIYTNTHAAIPHSHSDLQKQIYFKKFLFSLCRFWTILAYGWISWWNIDLNWVFEYIHTKTNFQAIYCFVRTCCILAWIRVYGCLCCLCVFNSCLFFLSFYFLCFVSFIADIDMYITYFCVFFCLFMLLLYFFFVFAVVAIAA